MLNNCECGCGQSCKNRFVSGHNSKGKSAWNKNLTKETNAGVAMIAEKQRGRVKSQEQRDRIRQTMIGRRHSEKAKQNMKISKRYSLHSDWTIEQIEFDILHDNDKSLCLCGCGQLCKNCFVNGHNRKGVSSWNKGLTATNNKKIADMTKKSGETLSKKYQNDQNFREKRRSIIVKMHNKLKTLFNAPENKEWREQHRKACVNSWTDERRKKQGLETAERNRKTIMSDQTRKKRSQNKKIFWANLTQDERDAYNQKRFQGWKNSPNSIEKQLINIVNNLSLSFVFVGNGYTWIRGKNPDFINFNLKKVIELNGCWIHGCLQCYPNSKFKNLSEDRQLHYQKSGFSCLILWEHDLKNFNGVKDKLIQFVQGIKNG